MAISREYEIFYRARKSLEIPADLSIEEIRSRSEALMQQYPPAPEVRFESFSIGEMPAMWAFAPDVNRRRILLFFCGGGFISGSIESHKNLIGRLSAAAGAAVCAVQYRLAPEFPFPCALDDALTAYRWLLHHPYARSRILFSGISAGGGLALSLFLRLKLEQIAMPAGGICLCPWVDLSMKNESMHMNKGKDLLSPDHYARAAEQYAGDKERNNPLLSPLYGDLTGLPPLFIQTGTHDLLYTEAMQLAERAENQGVQITLDTWPNMVHAFQMFAPQFPESQDAIERAGEFVDNLFNNKSSATDH